MSDLIRREEAIKCLDGNILITGRNEAEAVKGYFEIVVNRLKALPSAELKAGGWIPCEERLPNETEAEYLICTDGGYMHSCRWTNANMFWSDLTTDWHWNKFDLPQYSKVVAWMPLKPYEIERRADED